MIFDYALPFGLPLTILLTALLGALGYALYYLLSLYLTGRQLPTGPSGLPFIGVATQLDAKRPHLTLSEWSKRYGELYSINLFGELVVVASSAEAFREVLVTKATEFGDRPRSSYRMSYLSHGNNGLTFTAMTDEWRLLKKAALRSLKMYGDGLVRLERISHDVIEDFLAVLASRALPPPPPDGQGQRSVGANGCVNGQVNGAVRAGEPTEVYDDIFMAIVNVMTSLVFGKKFDWNDADLMKMKRGEEISLNATFDPQGTMIDMFPVLRYIPNKICDDLKKGRQMRDDFYHKHLKPWDESFDQECVAKGIYDTYQEEKGSISEMGYFVAIIDLLAAGFMTTAVAMHCLVLILLNHPEEEAKIVSEIERVLKGRAPTIQDRADMPYVEATILELLRYISHGPILLPHQSSQDTTLRGRKIPKGTQIWLLAWELHRDAKIHQNPWKFNPERFITPEGKLLSSDDPTRRSLFVFGAGKRVCAGETLAKNRLFLFIVSTLQRFSFSVPDGEPTPSCDPRTYNHGMVLTPDPFKVVIRHRNKTSDQSTINQ